MPPWCAKSSSKESKKKLRKDFLIRCKEHLEVHLMVDLSNRSEGSRRRSDSVLANGSQSVAPSKRVGSFADRPQPLPLPGLHPSTIDRTDSGIKISPKSKSSLFLLPRPACAGGRLDPPNIDGDLATASISSAGSTDTEDPADSKNRSPRVVDYDFKAATVANSPSRNMPQEQPSPTAQAFLRELQKPLTHPLRNHVAASPKRRAPNLHIPNPGAFCSAPDSSNPSP